MQRSTLGFLGGVAIAFGAYLPIRAGSGIVEGAEVSAYTIAGLPVLVAGVIVAAVSLGARLRILDEAQATLAAGASAIVALVTTMLLATDPIVFPTGPSNAIVDYVDGAAFGLAIALTGVALTFLFVARVARTGWRAPVEGGALA